MSPEKPTGPLALNAAPALARRREVLEKLDVEPSVYNAANRRFPVQWPKYYLDLASSEAIARLGRPTLSELESDPGDIVDPISDRLQRPVPFIVRKHKNRVIVLAAKRCHFYCRFCFRREEPVQSSGEPDAEAWSRIFSYLGENPEIEEAILSGGDPLTLDDEALRKIRVRLEQIPSIKHWRIHSRAPVHFPQRMTHDLVDAITGSKPLRLITHYNHADEVTGQSSRVAELMQQAGITYKNQAVLLNGVNQTLQAQANLWRAMNDLGIQPHYLHHPDRVAGNAMFRLTIREGQELFEQMKHHLSIPLPEYVLDLPDGRGKVPVMALQTSSNCSYTYQHEDGSISHYRDFS